MLDAFVEKQTRTIRGNKILIGLRLLIATVSLLVLLIQEFETIKRAAETHRAVVTVPLYFSPPGLVALIVCFLTILYLLADRRCKSTPSLAPKLAFLQVFVDIFLISALVWNSGGVESQFVVLYLIAICSSAFVLKWNAALITAGVSTLLFGLVAILYSSDQIPDNFVSQSTPAQLERLRNLSPLDFVRFLLLPVCAFFLTGGLAGTLSKRLAVDRLLRDEILEGIGEGILVVDNQRIVSYYNKAFARLVNLGPDAAGETLASILGEELDEKASDVLAGGEPARHEIVHRRVGKGTTPISVRIFPIADVDGPTPRGVILALADITAEKKMEEFAKHRQRIETMGKISATIAHEIRNPLASIRGAVQEIGRSVQIPENKKILVDIVLAESDRLDQIIADFLRFARMRPPNLALTDLGRVLSDVKLLLGARPDMAGITISLSGDEGEPFQSDPEQLRQALLNLSVNAIHAMEASPVKRLAFRTRVATPLTIPGFPPEQATQRGLRNGVLIEIEDTGCGMSDTVRSQIFEPFFTTKNAGTGLGLAIVERIVLSHEGIIMVDSIEGKGTTFRIWLPTDLKFSSTVSGFRAAV